MLLTFDVNGPVKEPDWLDVHEVLQVTQPHLHISHVKYATPSSRDLPQSQPLPSQPHPIAIFQPLPQTDLERIPVIQLQMQVCAEPEVFLNSQPQRLENFFLHVKVHLLLKHGHEVFGVSLVSAHSHGRDAVTQGSKHVLESGCGFQGQSSSYVMGVAYVQ